MKIFQDTGAAVLDPQSGSPSAVSISPPPCSGSCPAETRSRGITSAERDPVGVLTGRLVSGEALEGDPGHGTFFGLAVAEGGLDHGDIAGSSWPSTRPPAFAIAVMLRFRRIVR